MHSVWLGEYLGTLVLLYLGGGVNAGVTLRKSYAADAGWLVVATGWGLAVLCGVLVAQAFGSSGAHLNPAITLAAAVNSGDFSQLPCFWSAQMLGAIVGAVLVWLHFLPHWRETEDPGAKLACFSTMPAIRNFGTNLLSEMIGTFVLLLGVAVIFSKKVAIGGPAGGLGPYLVGVLVWAIGLSLGGTTGYAINPARDLGPRIVHSLLPLGRKTGSGWSYAAVPVIGPLMGAGLAGLFVRLAHL